MFFKLYPDTFLLKIDAHLKADMEKDKIFLVQNSEFGKFLEKYRISSFKFDLFSQKMLYIYRNIFQRIIQVEISFLKLRSTFKFE